MSTILILLASLLVVGNAYGEALLTQADKEGLVGEYRFEGDFKNDRGLLIELGNPLYVS